MSPRDQSHHLRLNPERKPTRDTAPTEDHQDDFIMQMRAQFLKPIKPKLIDGNAVYSIFVATIPLERMDELASEFDQRMKTPAAHRALSTSHVSVHADYPRGQVFVTVFEKGVSEEVQCWIEQAWQNLMREVEAPASS